MKFRNMICLLMTSVLLTGCGTSINVNMIAVEREEEEVQDVTEEFVEIVETVETEPVGLDYFVPVLHNYNEDEDLSNFSIEEYVNSERFSNYSDVAFAITNIENMEYELQSFVSTNISEVGYESIPSLVGNTATSVNSEDLIVDDVIQGSASVPNTINDINREYNLADMSLPVKWVNASNCNGESYTVTGSYVNVIEDVKGVNVNNIVNLSLTADMFNYIGTDGDGYSLFIANDEGINTIELAVDGSSVTGKQKCIIIDSVGRPVWIVSYYSVTQDKSTAGCLMDCYIEYNNSSVSGDTGLGGL